MKKLAFHLIVGLTVISLQASELIWQTDLAKALAKAKTEKKMVLLNFTGSDWCEDCKNLDAEVFTTAEFREYVQTNLVLVAVDILISTPQPSELKKANESLAEKYDVHGWPTLVLLDAKGETMDRIIGYRKGAGPKAVIAKLECLRKKI